MFGPPKKIFAEVSKQKDDKTKRKKLQEAPPGPGDGASFSSFERAATRGRTTTLGKSVKKTVSRKREADDSTPGPGAHSPRVDVASPRTSSAVMSPKKSHSRKRAEDSSTPAPGEHGEVYSSFKKASEGRLYGGYCSNVFNMSKRRSTSQGSVGSFGKPSDREPFRHWADTPGPAAYSVSDELMQPTSYSATLGTKGGSRPDYLRAKINSSGFVELLSRPTTNRAPGDCVEETDFDISAKTFNTYAKMQAASKSRMNCSPSLTSPRSCTDRSSLASPRSSIASPRAR
eukprot:TRINITY_DN39022_c0_g1_i1.p1 TRINITY_DN39022_c0_g1~~TRINITY_DN39022_c0_g1_i1.p1  ORF type:complete len:287 (+),score=78.21 TRINITY_DN39022_c0_g1_i1:76-936(+)